MEPGGASDACIKLQNGDTFQLAGSEEKDQVDA